MENYKIIIASDHAGYNLKQKMISFCKENNWEVIDLGTNNDNSVNYVDFGKKLAHSILQNKLPNVFGVGICGSGIGISMSLNRFKGIRAALCRDTNDAALARLHNNANVLALGSRITTFEKSIQILKVFVTTSFESGRHLERIKTLDN